MGIVRTIIWVLLTALLVLFAVNNWHPVEVRIWQSLILETKLPALVIAAFLLGLVPMWLIHRAALWRYRRRVSNLEATLARSSAPLPPPPTPPTSPAPPPEPLA